MKIKQIFYSSHFERKIKSFPPDKKLIIKERIVIFQGNCFDPRLKTHKLHGVKKERWSFSVTYSDRILFTFTEDGSAYFIDVGGHSIYQ